MKFCARSLAAVALISITVPAASAQSLYWDIDGVNPGSGGATPAGTWDTGTTSNWTTDPGGAIAGTTWSANADAVFAAGSDATGAYSVTVTGTNSLKSLTVEEGAITQLGGTLDFGTNANAVINVATGASWINAGVGTGTITGTAGITKSGAGTLSLGSAETFSSASGAQLTITQGVVDFTADLGLGAVPSVAQAAAVTIDGGTLRFSGSSAVTLNVKRGVTIGPNGGTIDVVNTTNTGLSLPASATFTLNGGGTLTKVGLGRFTLNTTANTFTGKYVVKAGTLNAAGDGRFGTAPTLVTPDYFTLDGGALRFVPMSQRQWSRDC
jgi:autotransporter-associated beta strand protein